MTSLGTLQTAAAVHERARELAGGSWDELEGADAVAAVEAITAARGLLDAALLRGIDRVTDTDALRPLGWASVKDWLTHLTGGHKGTGGGLVRAADQLRDLPAVQAALEDGRVTLPQARAIAAHVHTLPRVPEFRTAVGARLLDLVATEGLDASALDCAFDGVVRELDPAGEIRDSEKERTRAERGAHQARFLSFAPDQHGGVRVKGYGTPEDVDKIKTVVHSLAAPVTTEPGACGGKAREPGQPTFDEHGVSTGTPCPEPGCRHDGTDPREHGARLWDALVEVCDRLRATETLPRDHGALPRVTVTIDHRSLREDVIAAGLADPGATTTGTRLSASTVRRLACDAEILPAVLGTDSQVLDVGRAHRLVTPALWSALILRDRHCAFPGCTRMPLACDAHHLVHWADGGATELDNLVMLCRHHHTITHHTPWAVQIDATTRRPVWTGPPRLTLASLQGKISYRLGTPPGAPPGAPPGDPPSWVA